MVDHSPRVLCSGRMIDPNPHPSFPQPSDPDALLWRYMDGGKFEWLVSHRRLYVPRADHLGDDLEGTTPGGEINYWRNLYEEATTDEQRATIVHNRSFFAEMSQKLRTWYFVSCWHMNDHENNVMWGSYTSTHDAVAIRTTYSTMRKVLPEYLFAGAVRYIDYETSRFGAGPDMANMFEWIMHKELCFAGEREVRFIAVPPHGRDELMKEFSSCVLATTKVPDVPFYAPPIDLQSVVQEIVLHPDATRAFVDRMKALASAHGLPEPRKSRRRREPTF